MTAKRMTLGRIRIGSATHAALVLVADGFASDQAEPEVIKRLASSGFIVRTYSLTDAGRQALANAITVKPRRSRRAAEFDLGPLAGAWNRRPSAALDN